MFVIKREDPTCLRVCVCLKAAAEFEAPGSVQPLKRVVLSFCVFVCSGGLAAGRCFLNRGVNFGSRQLRDSCGNSSRAADCVEERFKPAAAAVM